MMPTERDHEREAILQIFEDCEDYLLGIAVLERNEPTIALDELERRLGPARRPTSEA
jgi:hypothetical protein